MLAACVANIPINATNMLISLIMPTRNHGKYVGNTIDSCLWQTHKNWELIIIDDDSTDDTATICTDYAKRDNRIKYYKTAHLDGQPIGHLWDFGLSKANGVFIKCVDSDDVLFSRCLETEGRALSINPKLVAVSGDIVQSAQTGYIDLSRAVASGTLSTTLQNPITLLANSNNMPDISMFRKQPGYKFAANDIPAGWNAFPYRWRMWVDMSIHGYFGKINMPTYIYRQHNEAVSKNDWYAKEAPLFTWWMRNYIIKKWGDNGVMHPVRGHIKMSFSEVHKLCVTNNNPATVADVSQPTKTVTLIMATRNYGKYISNAIDSCIAQTLTDWELIIVDESSTDDTAEICWNYCEKDNRIKYVMLPYQDDKLLGRNYDFGLKYRHGRYVKMVDSDDVLYPNCLEIESEILKNNEKIVAVCGKLVNRSEPSYIHCDSVIGDNGIILVDPIDDLAKGNLFPDVSMCKLPHGYIFNRGDEPMGLTTYPYRWRLWVELSTVGNLARIDTPTYIYRQHQNSTSRQHNPIHIHKYLELMFDYIEDVWGNEGVWIGNTKTWLAPTQIHPTRIRRTPRADYIYLDLKTDPPPPFVETTTFINKPTVLIIEPNEQAIPNYKRCVQYKDYINQICASKRLNVFRTNDHISPLQNIIHTELHGNEPDYIFPALIPSDGFAASGNFLPQHRNIKVIADASDTDSFASQKARLGEAVVDHLILRHPCPPAGMDNVLNIMKQHPRMFGNTRVHYIPPGVNTDIFRNKGMYRDIDVAMVCTIHERFGFHQHRRFMRPEIQRLPCKTFVGGAWGDDYISILNRTKIFLVDGAMRRHLVEKYLEGAMCGTLLMGEIPTTATGIFVDGVSIINIPNYGTRECLPLMREKINYYLSHEDERKLIADECTSRVKELYSQKSMVSLFEDLIIENHMGGCQ